MQEHEIDRSNALSKAINSLKVHLTSSQKKKMIGLSILIFISAVLDVFGLASILPLVKLATEPSLILKNKILSSIYYAGHFSNEKKLFIICNHQCFCFLFI